MQANLSRKAFTLIELLIVVAIIAILAAIAVPNFLEAQTRSKVSRAKADMRSLATALESYAVDNNRYPRAYSAASNGTVNPRIRRLEALSSPVAYIATIPLDVFNLEEATAPTKNEDVRVFLYADRKSYANVVPQPFSTTSNGQPDARLNLYRTLWRADYPESHWILRSRGPKLGTMVGSAVGNDVTKLSSYDPSNGTVSTGNIIMIGGAGFLDGK